MTDRKSVSEFTDSELADLYDHAEEMENHARELAETISLITAELAASQAWLAALSNADAQRTANGG